MTTIGETDVRFGFRTGRGPEEVDAWRVTDRTRATCELGCEHELEHWVRKHLHRVGEYDMNNGYEVRTMPVYADAQGRLYYARQEIDYHASTYYVRQDEPGAKWLHFVGRPSSYGGRIAVDAYTGQRLGPNGKILRA